MNSGQQHLISFFTNTKLVSQQNAGTIAAYFTEKIIQRNELHLKEGRVSDEYLFLEDGFMRAYTHDVDGNEVTTAFYVKNQVVFEVSSFFNRSISKENIQALTDSRGWVITYEQLNNLFHTIPEFREFGRAMLVKGFASLKQRMLSMINETAEERYVALIKNNPEIFQHAALKHIAAYLGITDSSLSRIRNQFVKK